MTTHGERTLTRTHPKYPTRTYKDVTYREAQKFVAWCATDNLLTSRRVARAFAAELAVDIPLRVGDYMFKWSREDVT